MRTVAARRTLCSRADVLRALDEDPRLGSAVAQQLDLHKLPLVPEVPLQSPARPPLPSYPDESSRVQAGVAAALPVENFRHHHVKRVEALVSLDTDTDGLEPASAPPLPAALPSPVHGHFPLCSWPRLWLRLELLLGRMRQTRQLDVPRIVADLARGAWVSRLPLKRHRRLPRRLCVVLDRSRALTPFWEDQELVYWGLTRRLGEPRLERVSVFDGEVPTDIPIDEQVDAVLVLGDLASSRLASVQADWLGWGSKLARLGIQPVALSPLPAARIAPALRSVFQTSAWEQGVTQFSALDADELRERAEKLLALASPAIRVEPGLLRAIRRSALPGVDAGSEADVCMHSAVDVCSAIALVLFPEKAAELRTRLTAATTEEQRATAIDAITAFHAHLPPEILAEELAGLSALLPQDRVSAADSIVRARAYLRWEARNQLWLEHQLAGEQESIDAAQMWYRGLAWRIPSALWKDPELGQPLRAAFLRVNPSSSEVPPGLELRPSDFATDVAQRYAVYQIGVQLHVLPMGQRPSGPAAPRGVLITEIATTAPWLDVRSAGVDDKQFAQLRLGRGTAKCKLPDSERYVLETDLARYAIEANGFDRPCKTALEDRDNPYWADLLASDGTGLYAEVELDYSIERLDWKVPHIDRTCEGAWVARSKPSWASHFGADDYGLYADFELKGVTQRMRWIPAGEFVMGSPESEANRFKGETAHEVVLTHGFWLADTACTQRLWQAVMGKNPSSFEGEERPVETVSWEDCQEFLNRCESLLPGLGLELPTEAQWEYACRADTRTPFWFGENITPEQVNYNGNYPYTNEAKGKYRENTVDVEVLPCNGWGLYQMHGNVYEWCSDWYGEYPEGRVTDPSGPDMGADRVLRGGWWSGFARYARSANRYSNEPDYRSDGVGFRVSRGRISKPRESLDAGGGGQRSSVAELRSSGARPFSFGAEPQSSSSSGVEPPRHRRGGFQRP